MPNPSTEVNMIISAEVRDTERHVSYNITWRCHLKMDTNELLSKTDTASQT